MADRTWVADASVLGAAFFEEEETQAARSFLARESQLIAPALLAIEVASIAAKKVWKGLTTAEVGERAVMTTPRLVTLVHLSDELVAAAFRLSRDHRYSAYDATYLALAAQADAVLITLDAKLVARADSSGQGRHLRLLTHSAA